ncbi:IS66 family transposase [Salmonella enterica subsp. enterica]|nr:IS66 family transposase [Salmonella enterica subsp. salamae]EDH1235869.1 IS66 family transposase [Salmonella enterica subsp. enterica]EDV9722863.1 IS66 family transposase [Salmonella enterica subsp. salamae]
MIIHAGCGIITRMDISVLSTTNDIEQLRTLALAMVQKVVSEQAETEKLQQRILLLEEALKLARQQRFGKKGETLAGMQRSLFEEDVDADIAAVEAQLDKLLPDKEKAPPERPARKALPAHLPRVTKTIEPASTESCPDCQGVLRHIRDEVSEKLEYIPARVVVNRYVRPQYGCTCCQRMVSGDMPAHIVPKGVAEPSLIAQLVISKHCDHMPLYRQQPVLARSDIHLPVSTMADMVGRAGAALTPLAESLHRMLLTRDVLHADETPLQILDTKKGGKACSGYLWAYVSGEKSGPAIVCFDSQPGRSSRYAAEYLKGWAGNLMVDGYPAYETLAGQNKGIALTGCWAHARRNFADLYKVSKDPRAEMAVRQIAGLYRLEKKIRHRPVEKIRQWRNRYARPVLEKLWQWLELQQDACPESSALGKAIAYTLKRRITLSRFLENGALPLDNNRCERAIRPVVMGRSNWFAGSVTAGERAAKIMSLLETAKMNGLDAHAWLTDVLQRLPGWPEEELDVLLPLPGFAFGGGST